MPETHDIGSFYWHTIRLRKGTARIHSATTQEIEWPFRSGSSLVLRCFGEHGIVIGRWTGRAPSEEEALSTAIAAREEYPFGPDGALQPAYRRPETRATGVEEATGTRMDQLLLNEPSRRAVAPGDARADR